VTNPNGLPYAGALEAVKRIENALTERDATREETDAELNAARAEAERLLAAAHVAGTRAADERRDALLASAHADAEMIRAAGDAEARQLGERVSAHREMLAAELTALILVEEP
jgi:hypothetical protein